MSRRYPPWGAVPPERAEADLRAIADGRIPQWLWTRTAEQRSIVAGLATPFRLFPTTARIATHIFFFADEDNSVTVHIGKSDMVVTGGSRRGIDFSLAPGRGAVLYVDDFLTEMIDVSQYFANHEDPAATQQLYVSNYTARRM